MRYGPIVMIEDDPDDAEMFGSILNELNPDIPFVSFENTREGKEFLLNHPVKPFIIICDVNRPGQNGLAFKQEIDEMPQLRKKKHPLYFLFHIS